MRDIPAKSLMKIMTLCFMVVFASLTLAEFSRQASRGERAALKELGRPD